MKSPILKIFVVSFLLATMFQACKKSSSSSTPSKTKTDLLTQASWKFSTATVGGADVSSLLQSCQKDNILTFQSNGNGSLDEGPTKCNSGDPQTNPFTWTFQSSETMIHVSAVLFTGGSSDFTLVSLTETQLVLSQNITLGGTTQNAVVTFIH
ncbi:MAG: lipocalin family protein [Bacteroidetes bacterium]|nr:lipocalin family protein [Bacteroidota bacterium]MBS1930805.1 lipocalin family protein [Bacteroidota bacterium]